MQQSLFACPGTLDEAEVVAFAPVFGAWQLAARERLCAGLAPAALTWNPEPARLDARGGGTAAPGPAPTNVNAPRVPRDFIRLARAASCHRAPDRWALLYRVLWRLTHGERYLLALVGDPEVARLARYAAAVRRDVHKMKAFVRFRRVNEDPERYAAWFEPEHPIVERAAPFFEKRFANMAWSIVTPWRSVHWQPGAALYFTAGADRSAAPAADAAEHAWRAYYRSICNPARLKVAAMQAEMPQKYWKNLPEASEIGALIKNADAAVAGMESQAPSDGRLRCGPRPATPAAARAAAAAGAPRDTLARLAREAASCRACGLCERATQTVFGEGPTNARFMLIGEQPGDAEDLAGRPFVGPAGQTLDRALDALGIDRTELYLTNAVKHFKFTPRGKRRVHAKPAYREISACRDWLTRELEQVAPERIVCLGATAARALLGRSVAVERERGVLIQLAEQRVAMITTHPAYLLRADGAGQRTRASARFRADLARALKPAEAPRGPAGNRPR